MISSHRLLRWHGRPAAVIVAAAMFAPVATMTPPLPADIIPLATNVGDEHLDTCDPENSNIYRGPLTGGTGVAHSFNDDFNSSEPWLVEVEIILIGKQATSAAFGYPAHTTPVGSYWTAGQSDLGVDYSYAYTAWKQEDRPETGQSRFVLTNTTGYDNYYSVAITEAYAGIPSTVNPPDPLPGWFDVDAIITNALAPGGGNVNNPEAACGVGMAGWQLLIDAPEPGTLTLLALGGLALLRRRHRRFGRAHRRRFGRS